MSNFVFTLFIGVLTIKESCHNYNCKIIKTYNRPCQVSFDGAYADLLGIKMLVKQYMYGPVEGWDGNNGTHEVTIFMKNKQMYRAYVSQYITRHDYFRWTCEFPNKKACYSHLTIQ